MAKGILASSMKWRRRSAVKISPSTVPPSVTTSICHMSTSALLLRMNMPGTVKASPPATIEPADIAVWVTFISLTLVPPSALSEKTDTSVTKSIGHGRAEALSATNMDEQVSITAPSAPISIPRRVSCALSGLFSFSFIAYSSVSFVMRSLSLSTRTSVGSIAANTAAVSIPAMTRGMTAPKTYAHE